MSQLLNQEQIAKLAEVSTKTLQRYVAAGKIKPMAKARNGHLYFELSQVEEVKRLWWGGKKKSGKRKTVRSGVTGKIVAARLAAARSLRARLLTLRQLPEAAGLEDLL